MKTKDCDFAMIRGAVMAEQIENYDGSLDDLLPPVFGKTDIAIERITK